MKKHEVPSKTKQTGAALIIAAAFCLPAQINAAQNASILFIGNSYTYVNDMPNMFSAIAKSLGREVTVDIAAPGGFTWQQHAQDKDTLAKINSRQWTFVVLQEQSQRPGWPAHQLKQVVIPYALELDKLIRASGAKTVFFETWGHKTGDKGNCKKLPETCTYDGMQNRIIAAYTQIARETGGALAPVGAAWRKARTEHPEIELYTADGIHPSKQGSYLAACVFYTALFRKGVFGADKLSLPAKEAEILQKIAQEAVFHPEKSAE